MSGIYLHWPFCLSRCAYCDFVSGTDFSTASAYSQALLKEIDSLRLPEAADTVFFGGGTPSLCRAGTVSEILSRLDAQVGIRPGAEITVEMNPRTASGHWLGAVRESGVNRVSLGVQAAQDRLLRILGRRQSAADAVQAFRALRQAGFENASVDLMYGIPGQSAADWDATLQFACQLGPEHISCYCLSLEEGTPLVQRVAAGFLPAPDEDAAAEMYVRAQQFLTRCGYRQYEISNWAKDGFACRHNLKYWTLQDYAGLGAAAHSMIGSVRTANTSSPTAYVRAMLGGSALCSAEEISPSERQREFFMLTTRLAAGFSPAEFEKICGVPFRAAGRSGLMKSISQGLMAEQDGRFRPTACGMRFQSRIALLLMGDVDGSDV